MAIAKNDVSNVVLEVLEGAAGSFVEFTAGNEREGIIVAIAHRIGRNVEYKVWRVEGSNRAPVVSAVLGYQVTRYSPAWNSRDGLPPDAVVQAGFDRVGLEEIPFLQVVLTIDATLLTLQQKYIAHLEADREQPIY